MPGRTSWLLVLALAVAACERERVKVTVEPGPDGTFVRTIRIWREDTEKPGEVLPPSEAALAAATAVYGPAAASAGVDAAVTFRGTFRAVPADLAPAETPNRGAYDAFRTAAGWCGLYRERRPGPTDFHARFEAAAKAIDFGARLQVWLARRFLAGDEGLPDLVERLEGPWRRDMRDLLFLLMTSARADPPPGASLLLPGFAGLSDGTFLAALELIEERGYLRMTDWMAFDDGRLRDRHAVFLRAYAAGLTGRKVDTARWAKLAPLAEKHGLENAVKEAIAAMGVTGEEVDRTVESLAFALRHFNRQGVPTFELEFRLPPGARNLGTTGEVLEGAWVRFRDELGESLVRDVFVASFTVADREWQRERFGCVPLDGERLARYARWLASLPSGEAAAWEAAVAALTPGPDLVERVRALRDLSKDGARILLDALEEAK